MNNKLSIKLYLLLVVILVFGTASTYIRANADLNADGSILEKSDNSALLQVADLQKYTRPSLDHILSKEVSEFEQDGIKAVIEDIRTDTHRIIITRTDSGSSVFVEDIATGMAYQVEEDVVTEIVDLNEIRNTINTWEMPEEDQKAFEEHDKKLLENGEEWSESTLPAELKGRYTIDKSEEGVIIEPIPISH